MVAWKKEITIQHGVSELGSSTPKSRHCLGRKRIFQTPFITSLVSIFQLSLEDIFRESHYRHSPIL